jgi:hydroxylysine kinase
MLSKFENDPLLSAPPVLVTPSKVTEILCRHFGLFGRIRQLSSERDANFRVDTHEGCFLLKITNSGEDPDVTDMQTSAIRYLEKNAPSLPVPRIIATLDGQDHAREVLVRKTHIVRLMSFLPGNPLGAGLFANARSVLGKTLAQLDVGLRGFNHPAASHDLLWNASNALRVKGLIHFVNDGYKRQLAENAIREYEEFAMPRLAKLRHQVIHNDFNPHNVLIEDGISPVRVSGVIDFGDIVSAPLISEVSTAIAYQEFRGQSTMDVVSDVVGAYHKVLPLMSEELDVLLDLVRARQILVGVITAWRAARQPKNVSYILKNSARAWTGLEALDDVPREKFRESLATVCEG